MVYGQIDKPTKGKNMLDKYMDAYRNYVNYNNPKPQEQKIMNKDGASVFDGYFGGSNSIAGTSMVFGDGYTIMNGWCYPDDINNNKCPQFTPIPEKYLIKPQGRNR